MARFRRSKASSEKNSRKQNRSTRSQTKKRERSARDSREMQPQDPRNTSSHPMREEIPTRSVHSTRNAPSARSVHSARNAYDMRNPYDPDANAQSRESDADSMRQQIKLSQARTAEKRRKRKEYQRKMRKRRIRSILLLVLIAGIAYGSWWAVDRFLLTKTLQSIPSHRAEANRTLAEDLLISDTSNRPLTKAEKLADLAKVHDVIQESYPRANVSSEAFQRWSDAYPTWKKMVEETTTDLAFYEVMAQGVAGLGDLKTRILTPEQYQSRLNNAGQDFYQVDSPYVLALRSTRVADRYQRLQPSVPQTPVERHQPSLEIHGANRVAVLKNIDLRIADVANDRDLLAGLLTQAKKYPYIVIDLRGVNGESTDYWTKNIASPLSRSDQGASSTMFIKGGFDDYIDYLSVKESLETFDLSDGRQEISMLLPQSLQDQISDMRYAKQITYSILADSTGGFHGKIFLLTDENTRGTADSFASFSRQTKFATVAGRATGGGGWDVPAFLAPLSHSGLVLEVDVTASSDPAQSGLIDTVKTNVDVPLQGDDLLQSLLTYITSQ